MKKRISLTLDQNILKRADRLVGRLADNRSSVFDVLIERALASLGPKTAVLLVGIGKEKIVMQEFEGEKIIDVHLRNLKASGVNRFIIVGQELSELREYLKGRDSEFFFVNDRESGTAGALREAKHLLKETFFLVYGDTVSELDYSDLYRFHTEHKTIATMALTTSSEPSKFGVVEIKGPHVIGFREKPAKSENLLVSAGSFVVEPEIIELVQKEKSSLEKNILPRLVSMEQLSGYLFSGKWADKGV